MAREGRETTPEAAVAEFVSGLEFSDIADEIPGVVERAFVDTIGVTVAGSRTGAGKRVMTLAAGEQGDTQLIGHDSECGLLEGVFANATAGHTLDFDDTALPATDGHPSVSMVAPILAVGDRTGATGRDLVTAYVAGFETQASLNAPISPGHYERGWHATATIGTFGATAAAASLLDLSTAQTQRALAIAASFPSGLKRNFGTMTKPVHAGQAARSGVTAARLAAEGIDADSEAVSGDGGFFDLYAGDSGVDLSGTHELGEQWALLSTGIDVKKYACCHYTHAAIYGTEHLLETNDIEPNMVEAVHVTASQGAVDAVKYDDPASPTQAKFSMPYLIAYTLSNGTVDLAAFDPDALADPEIANLQEAVEFTLDAQRPYDSYGATITVELVDGTRYERRQNQPPGAHSNPLTDAELTEKFEMCTTGVLTAEAATTLSARLSSLRDIDSVSELTTLLSP